MALHDPSREPADGRLYADLTQSWSDVGGGVGTYLRHKRRHILERTPNRHLMIVPGAHDTVEVEEGGRAITCFIASPKVPGSPHYRLMLRNRAVRAVLEEYGPDLIECQDAYNLPWAAIGHRQAPSGHRARRRLLHRLSHRLCRPALFEVAWAPDRRGGLAAMLRLLRKPLSPVRRRLCDEREWRGVEASRPGRRAKSMSFRSAWNSANFRPSKRDPRLRRRLGLGDAQPLLIYVGRLDGEKRPDVVVEAFRQLPQSLGAALLLLGDGPYREQFAGRTAERIFAPGYCTRPQRPCGMARQRRPLCLGDGRRDVRHFDHRGAGVGAPGGRGRGRRDDRPRSRRPRAWWARSAMRRRWRPTSWPFSAGTCRRWASRRAPMRSSSAGTRAWSACSAGSMRAPASARPNGRSGFRGPRRSAGSRLNLPNAERAWQEPTDGRALRLP